MNIIIQDIFIRYKRLIFLILLLFKILFIFYIFWSSEKPRSFGARESCNKSSSSNLFELERDVSQDDPRVLNYLRKFHLTPPSKRSYTLFDKSLKRHPSHYGKEISKLFAGKKNGIFVEAGANDGEVRSNTLKLELFQNWTGLLIEPDPYVLTKLRLINRKAWISDNCLSLYSYPIKERFMHYVRGKKFGDINGRGVVEESNYNSIDDFIFAGTSECFPMYSIILASLNTTVIDYLSLDVEGIELKILKAIPYHLLTIKVMSVEYNLIPEGYLELVNFLKSKNYEIILKIRAEIFAVHRDYLSDFKI